MLVLTVYFLAQGILGKGGFFVQNEFTFMGKTFAFRKFLRPMVMANVPMKSRTLAKNTLGT